MKILSISQKCLRFVGLGRQRDIPVAGKRVSRTLARCIIIGGQLMLAIIFAFNLIGEWERGLYAIVFPLHSVLLVAIKLSIYVVLIAKAERMAGLIDHLQSVIEWRMFCATTFLAWEAKLSFFVCFLFASTTAGCEQSTVSAAIYAKQNANEMQILKSIFVGFSGLVIFSFIPPILCWLSTTIFGTPSADHWVFPLHTDKLLVIYFDTLPHSPS